MGPVDNDVAPILAHNRLRINDLPKATRATFVYNYTRTAVFVRKRKALVLKSLVSDDIIDNTNNIRFISRVLISFFAMSRNKFVQSS